MSWLRRLGVLNGATVLLVLVVLSGAAAAPTSGTFWKTPASVVRTFKSRPLDVLICTGSCSIYKGITTGYQEIQVHVITARTRGIGREKTIADAAHYGLFEVRVCAIDYLAGGARVSAHIRWHTGVNTSALRTQIAALEQKLRGLENLINQGKGTPAVIQAAQKTEAQINQLKDRLASNSPYAEDWQFRGITPLLYSGCRA
jgi:hypothetical protein